MGFGEINKYLKRYYSDLISYPEFDGLKYQELMQKIYEISEEVYVQGCDYFKGDHAISLPQKEVPLEETLELVSTYFYQVDPSILKKFDSMLQDGVIHFTTMQDLENIEQTKENYFYFQSLAGCINDEHFVNIVLENTITDAFILVHEVSHLMNSSDPNYFSTPWLLYTEGYAQFFETDFYLFLLKNGKHVEEARIYYESLLLSLLNRSATFIGEYFVWDIYLTYGRINMQKIYKNSIQFPNPSNGVLMAKESIELLLDSLKKDYSKVFLEDMKYMVALPFSYGVQDQYEKDKDVFLEEYQTLEKGSSEYYLKKYLSQKENPKLYRYGRKNF